MTDNDNKEGKRGKRVVNREEYELKERKGEEEIINKEEHWNTI